MSDRHIPNVIRPFEDPYLTHEERQELVNGLMDLAAWIKASNFPIPKTAISYSTPGLHVPSTYIDDESFVKRPGTAAKLIGGRIEKGELYKDGPFTLTRDFGGGVQFKFSIAREAVCESYVVTEMQDTYDQVPVDPDAEMRVTENLIVG